MNQVYRLVWSHVVCGWVAVSEASKGRGKVSGSKLIAAAVSLSAVFAHAAPVGGQVTQGTGSIAQSGATTTIKQSTPTLSLDWKSFNVGAQETVNFVQPSAAAIAVNRIFDINGTKILGNLNANGQVYLINPNGVLFGRGAQVNVGGLVASTLDLKGNNVGGTTQSFGGAGSGSVINQGSINAATGGYVALLGNTVINEGTITAYKGSVAMGAGTAATLTFQNNSLVSMQIDQSVLNSMVANSGLIRADGGVVIMTAGARDSLLASVVNNTGVIQAQTVDNQSGRITVLGGMAAGTVNVGGRLDASAPNGGNGGFIETSGLRLTFASDMKITTASTSGKTGNWLIDPVDFTIAASGGDITGAALGTLLGSNSVTIQTVAGTNTASNLYASTGTKGDINVNDTVSWASNTLTLKADNNININSKMSGTGTAKLALQYGQAATASGNVSDYVVKAAVDLASGPNFSTKLGSDGTVKNYAVITTLGVAGSTTGSDLQGMMGNLAGNYALGANIDATVTAAWSNGLGFTSVGTSGAPFTGTLDGLGHTITKLVITPAAATANVGLIGAAAAGSVIANIGLIGGSVIGGAGTGGLVGGNTSGSINNSYNTGTVSGGAGTGGLVGSNVSGLISNSYTTGYTIGGAGTGGLLGGNTVGSVSNSYTTGIVVGAAGTGGLMGSNTTGNITNSYTTGKVTGAAGTGGLLGSNTTGNISNSYATGNVTGAAGTGGLLGGGTAGNVSFSYATGNVVGLASAGGLVSTITTGVISDSYATGTVTGNASSAGLVGTSTGTVSRSYASGNVISTAASSGGLVGTTTGPIDNSYATGNVSGGASSGQLVGTSTSTVTNSYASGNSTGAVVGGLVGTASTGAVTGSYWDGTAAPTLTSIGGTKSTTTAMQTKSTFAGYDPTIWTLKDGALPILAALIKTISVTATADNKTKVYDGNIFGGQYTVSYADPTQSTAGFTGLTFGGTSQAATAAGNYSILASGLTSTNKQYVFSYVPGVLSITAAPLSISFNGTRVYDGSNNVAASIFTLSGMKTGETLNLTGVGTVVDKNVGASKDVTLGSLALSNGTGLASNYTFTGGTFKASITRLSSVAWVGGATGNWFDPANWAGGAVPDLSNVANVVIPSGVNVSFNNATLVAPAQGAAVNVDSIGSAGSMTLAAGNLNVASSLRLASLTQSGGILGGAGSVALDSFSQTGGSVTSGGNFSVSQAFSQTAPGAVAVVGNVDITQLSGDLSISKLSGSNVALSARNGSAILGTITATGTLDVLAKNNITQTGPLSVTGASTLTASLGDITLANPLNDFMGPVKASGKNIALTDANSLTVALNASGDSTLIAGGDLSVSGTTHALSTTTTNGGKTTFGATVVDGNLNVNSAGPISQTGVLTVTGTPSIILAGVNVTAAPPVVIAVPRPPIAPIGLPPVVVPPIILPAPGLPSAPNLPVAVLAQTVITQLQSAILAPSQSDDRRAGSFISSSSSSFSSLFSSASSSSSSSDSQLSDNERRLKKTDLRLQVQGVGMNLPANVATTNN